MIDERIAARRAEVREMRRRQRLRRTITVAVLLLVVGLLVVLERSPLVGLEEVEVVGVEQLSAEAIREAAQLPLGTSTLRLRLKEAEQRIEALPLVREASAYRTDPLTVRIEVVERRPVLVAVGEGARRLVDRDGVITADGEHDDLVAVELRDEPPVPGGTVEDLPALANAHAAWRGLSGPLRAEVERLVADGPDELWLHLRSGTRVRFGAAERVDEKVRALGAVLTDLGETRVSTIDVRAPNAPVVIGADLQS